jgi:DNA-binding transcriptional MocR family regulator
LIEGRQQLLRQDSRSACDTRPGRAARAAWLRSLRRVLRERLHDLEPAGIAAGLHLVAYLPGDLDETTLVDAAARRGVALYGLAPYRIAHPGRPGLIFGYATLDERAIDEGVEVLADVVADARHSSYVCPTRSTPKE